MKDDLSDAMSAVSRSTISAVLKLAMFEDERTARVEVDKSAIFVPINNKFLTHKTKRFPRRERHVFPECRTSREGFARGKPPRVQRLSLTLKFRTLRHVGTYGIRNNFV